MTNWYHQSTLEGPICAKVPSNKASFYCRMFSLEKICSSLQSFILSPQSSPCFLVQSLVKSLVQSLVQPLVPSKYMFQSIVPSPLNLVQSLVCSLGPSLVSRSLSLSWRFLYTKSQPHTVLGKNKFYSLVPAPQSLVQCVDKKISHLNSCFTHISAFIHRIFKILVPTPHNQGYIMLGWHKNFKDQLYRS